MSIDTTTELTEKEEELVDFLKENYSTSEKCRLGWAIEENEFGLFRDVLVYTSEESIFIRLDEDTLEQIYVCHGIFKRERTLGGMNLDSYFKSLQYHANAKMKVNQLNEEGKLDILNFFIGKYQKDLEKLKHETSNN